ncbi:MAG: hypothetical protein KF819_21655 [Labilithrix sp.]|nr:hypothetical protein [Labilithrix sp.]
MSRARIVLLVVSSMGSVAACIAASEDTPPVGADLDASLDDTPVDGAQVDGASSTDAGAVDATDDALSDAGSDAAKEAGPPVLVATGYGHVLAVAANEADVYFSTYGTSTGGTYNMDGTVVRCPIAGGCAASATVVATDLDNPMFLAIDGSKLVIGAQGKYGSGNPDGHVYSCPLAGCGAGAVDRITLSPGLRNLDGLALKGGYAYWVQTDPTESCARARTDGSGYRVLGGANTVSSTGVTVDDKAAYWTHTYAPPAIHVAEFVGDGGRVLLDLGPVDGGRAPVNLTHDNGYLYFASVFDNHVSRVLVNGTALTVLAGGMHGPSWIVVDATHVYVGDYYEPWPIRRLPKSGGAATIVAHANKQLSSLAQNSSSLFWSTGAGGGEVWRLEK